jgi:hypothetical protein
MHMTCRIENFAKNKKRKNLPRTKKNVAKSFLSLNKLAYRPESDPPTQIRNDIKQKSQASA